MSRRPGEVRREIGDPLQVPRHQHHLERRDDRTRIPRHLGEHAAEHRVVVAVDLVVSRAARLTLLDETGISWRDAHWKDDLAAWLGEPVPGDVAHWRQELAGTLPKAGVEAPPLPEGAQPQCTEKPE